MLSVQLPGVLGRDYLSAECDYNEKHHGNPANGSQWFAPTEVDNGPQRGIHSLYPGTVNYYPCIRLHVDRRSLLKGFLGVADPGV